MYPGGQTLIVPVTSWWNTSVHIVTYLTTSYWSDLRHGYLQEDAEREGESDDHQEPGDGEQEPAAETDAAVLGVVVVWKDD